MSDAPFQPLGRDVGGLYESQRCLWRQLQRFQNVYDAPSDATTAEVAQKLNDVLAVLRTLTTR